MTYSHNIEHPKKDMVHDAIFKKVQPVNRSFALFFPGATQACVKAAQSRNIIGKNFYGIYVENNKEVYSLLSDSKPKNVHIHKQDLHKLVLKDVLGKKKLQFGYFDLCGLWNANEAYWLANNQQYLADTTDCIVTLNLNPTMGIPAQHIYRNFEYSPLPFNIDWEQTKWYIDYTGFKHSLNNKPLENTVYLNGLKVIYNCLYDFNVNLQTIKTYKDTKAQMLTAHLVLNRLPVRDDVRYSVISQFFKENEMKKTATKSVKKPAPKKFPRPKKAISRPSHLTPAQWAWSWDNPNSIRNRASK